MLRHALHPLPSSPYRDLSARALCVLLAVALLPAASIAAASAQASPGTRAESAVPRLTFTDIAAESGIDFVHSMGKGGVKFMVETMGSGGAFIDFDRDGDLDIYLVNGAPLPGYKGPGNLTSSLYRNDGGRFVDVTLQAGAGNTEYGMGICAGDYDNDGYQDLYLPAFGKNRMLHNRGDGTFGDATGRAGVGSSKWSSSCAFLDGDLDGDLDLIVVNYVDFSVENNKFCGDYANNERTYCHPNVYNGQRDVYYRNNGDGTFSNMTTWSGLAGSTGNGLGVVAGDYDGDGDQDIYIANDKTPNVLFRNDGGRFTDVTLLAGVGHGLNGASQAGMGTAFGDYDADGDLDLVVTNLDFENNTLYRNEGSGVFSDMSFPSGIGGVSMSFVGFGAEFLDFDNDGLLDLLIANGHILDNAEYFNDSTSYAQRNFIHRNIGGGRFKEIGLRLGADMAIPDVGRGLAVGDVDGDGDLDLLISVSGGAPRLMRNDGGNRQKALRIRLAGKNSNRDAVGVRVTVTAGGRKQVRELRSGGSYQAQSETILHFGLGGAARAESVEVRWPGGRRELYSGIPAGTITFVEGSGNPPAEPSGKPR
jgi:hypothetical protein